MERHVGKKQNIPCGVISSPIHIQNFTLSFRPFLGFEGTNQIADLVYNSFSLGMESHLLEIFSGHDTKEIVESQNKEGDFWSEEALAELKKVPGPFRGKAKKGVEKYAKEQNIFPITVEAMFAAREANS